MTVSSRPTNRTCTSGQGTSQLALVSGTLLLSGNVAETEWVSTDKPHPYQASGSSFARAQWGRVESSLTCGVQFTMSLVEFIVVLLIGNRQLPRCWILRCVSK